MFEPPLVQELRERLEAATIALLAVAEECVRAEARDGRVSRRVLQEILRGFDDDLGRQPVRKVG